MKLINKKRKRMKKKKWNRTQMTDLMICRYFIIYYRKHVEVDIINQWCDVLARMITWLLRFFVSWLRGVMNKINIKIIQSKGISKLPMQRINWMTLWKLLFIQIAKYTIRILLLQKKRRKKHRKFMSCFFIRIDLITLWGLYFWQYLVSGGYMFDAID